MERLIITTAQRESMVDVTSQIRLLAKDKGWNDGIITVFCPHTTCGITINEGFDPDVAHDITAFFRALVPQSPAFRHAEGNADAHIKASLFGSSIQVLVESGKILLGRWQAVWLFEGDGPRQRELWIKWLGNQ